MPYELSVNLEYMFTEAGDRIEDRMAAAAAAGYSKVEMFTTGGRDVPALARALADHGLTMWSVVADPRTRLIERETHEGYRAMFARACEDAVTLGCKRVVAGSGPGVPWMTRPVQLGIVAEAIASVVDSAAAHDLTIILEAVNIRHDHPGVLFSQTCDAVAVIEQVASPRVRLLYDLYHSVTEGEDPTLIVPRVAHLIEHIQVADTNGRGEPGSGTVDWPAMLRLFAAIGYTGPIGVECKPTGPDTGAAMKWFKDLAAGFAG